MRGILFTFAGLAAIASAGCTTAGNITKPYWRFECGDPGSGTIPFLYQQQSGPLQASGLVTMPSNATATGSIAAPRLSMAATMPDCSGCQPTAPARPGTSRTLAELAAGSDGCTWEDVCRELSVIDRRLQQLQPKEPLPLPKGP